MVHPEQFFSSWVAIIGKRDKYTEDDMKLFNSKLAQLDQLIEKLGHDSSPFAMGTENPTELDIHMYACLSRPYFTKDSVFHESIWTKMAWGQNKRVMRLFEAM